MLATRLEIVTQGGETIVLHNVQISEDLTSLAPAQVRDTSTPEGQVASAVSNYWGGPLVTADLEVSDKPYRKRVAHIIKEFIMQQGVDAVLDSTTSKFRAIFWTIGFLLAGAFFFYSMIPLTQAYFERAVDTTYTEIYSRGAHDFPEIMICPSYHWQIDCRCRLWYDMSITLGYEIGQTCADNTVRAMYFCILLSASQPNITGLCNVPSYVDVTRFLEDTSCGHPTPMMTDLLNGTSPTEFSLESLSSLIIQRATTSDGPYLTRSEMFAYGAPLWNEFVFDCDFDGTDCSEMTWYQYRTYRFYFNSLNFCSVLNYNTSDLLVASGRSDTLSLLLHMPISSFQLEFLEEFNPPTITIYLYKQGEAPNPATGQLLAVGYKNNIQFEEEVVYLKEGYGTSKCSTKVTVDAEACINECVISTLSKYCCDSDSPSGCPAFTQRFDSDCEENYTLCDHVKPWQFNCLNQLYGGDGEDLCLDADCPQPCTLTNFRTSNQLTTFPHPLWHDLDDYFEDPEYPQKNLIYLSISRSSLTRTEIKETPRVSFSEWMGTLGGNLGLWCGVSLMSVVYVVELLVILCAGGVRVILRHCYAPKPKLQNQSTQSQSIELSQPNPYRSN